MDQGRDSIRVVLRLDSSPVLARTLRRKGFGTIGDRRSMFVILRRDRSQPGKIYTLPLNLQCDDKLFIDCPEEVGVYRGFAYATVACGLAGRELTPYFVGPSRRNGRRREARYCVPEALVTVRWSAYDQKVSIMEHRICQNGKISLGSTYLWHGDLRRMPERFLKYQAAAKQAHELAIKEKLVNC